MKPASTHLPTCDSNGHGDEEHVEPTVRQEEPGRLEGTKRLCRVIETAIALGAPQEGRVFVGGHSMRFCSTCGIDLYCGSSSEFVRVWLSSTADQKRTMLRISRVAVIVQDDGIHLLGDRARGERVVDDAQSSKGSDAYLCHARGCRCRGMTNHMSYFASGTVVTSVSGRGVGESDQMMKGEGCVCGAPVSYIYREAATRGKRYVPCSSLIHTQSQPTRQDECNHPRPDTQDLVLFVLVFRCVSSRALQ